MNFNYRNLSYEFQFDFNNFQMYTRVWDNEGFTEFQENDPVLAHKQAKLLIDECLEQEENSWIQKLSEVA